MATFMADGDSVRADGAIVAFRAGRQHFNGEGWFPVQGGPHAKKVSEAVWGLSNDVSAADLARKLNSTEE